MTKLDSFISRLNIHISKNGVELSRHGVFKSGTQTLIYCREKESNTKDFVEESALLALNWA